jgi:hypothetical protein
VAGWPAKNVIRLLPKNSSVNGQTFSIALWKGESRSAWIWGIQGAKASAAAACETSSGRSASRWAQSAQPACAASANAAA